MLMKWLSVYVSEPGVGAGMDGGDLPMPNHPQQYCDPTSLFFLTLMRYPIDKQGQWN